MIVSLAAYHSPFRHNVLGSDRELQMQHQARALLIRGDLLELWVTMGDILA